MLRPILAMKWIEQNRGVVPTDFNVLVEKLITTSELRHEIDELLKAKRAGAELARGPRIELISQYIESELERWEEQPIADPERVPSAEQLDQLFRDSIAEAWQS